MRCGKQGIVLAAEFDGTGLKQPRRVPITAPFWTRELACEQPGAHMRLIIRKDNVKVRYRQMLVGLRTG